ncbi:LysR family transcriptional regulator [Marinibacterium profundimaris]|uniref:LysR family transcriptional regulator n=1 Tax=Marinibacterium profundimaris TaxID=1679460 RepID=A0A225NLJ0_9RHOB|nr:LysR family transcriptional regulator [Marinibacterium profundimaris]OWU74937.1 LysR family transcriptional regulator [Marinibacterium profundimaris]
MIRQRRFLPDLRLMQTFECAARHGNFTRAAEEMALTQSAVSRQVRELEAQLDKPLFKRLPGRVVMTAAGRDLLPEVCRLLEMAEITMRHANAGAVGDRVLAVNALPTFATRWLMPRLPAYLKIAPETRFDLTTMQGVFDLDERNCHLAIHYGQPAWPGGSCTYLCSEIVLPVVGGALRDRRIDSAGDLAGLPKIHLSDRPFLWPDWFARQGLEMPDAREGHWVDQFSLTIEAVRAGMGCALLPAYLIEPELESGALKVAIEIPHSTDAGYYIVTPERGAETAAAFRDWLLTQVSFRPLAG